MWRLEHQTGSPFPPRGFSTDPRLPDSPRHPGNPQAILGVGSFRQLPAQTTFQAAQILKGDGFLADPRIPGV